ncbi:MAG: hypothetical protein U9N61_00260 [Euryarchaeota archaeon]|nr:hypothetical protein [Euryarchaeota archaeon]
MDEILTDSERKKLKSMSLYWDEVSKRDDNSPLFHELDTVFRMLGPKLLFLVSDYIKLKEAGK